MNMLAKGNETRALTLADYEARIELYKEQIGTGYIGIGRTLNEAKAAGAVPHGQWERWVTETTGLTLRQAQRCMQAATEIRDGSALARLEMSKALVLLSSGLEEEAQEAMAEKAAEEGATVRQLREEIRKMKLQVVQETGATTEIREQLKRAAADRDSLTQQLKETVRAYQKRLDEETEKAYQQGQDDTVNMNREMQEKIDILKQQLKQMDQARQANLDHANDLNARTTKVIREKDERIRELEEAYKETGKALEAARELGGEKWDEGFRRGQEEQANQVTREKEINQALTSQIEELQEDLKAAEAREEKRAKQLEALRQERDSREMADARGGLRADTPGAVDLGAAVQSFLGTVGAAPQMGNLLAGMNREARETVTAYVEAVAKWVDGMRDALAVVLADGQVR